MKQQFNRVRGRTFQPARQENNQQLELEQAAGVAARQIIRASALEDTTDNWKALKRAYLAGYEAGQAD